MIRDIVQANESIAPNDHEISILKEYFPACFKQDGSFDIERFREFLSDKVHIASEGYELKFLGKNYARLLASLDTTTVIKPDEEHNAKPENAASENIYISGDNLDALKHLLKSYARQVKCIYIDPPYNTGSDGFVYNDKFEFTAEELSEKLSIDLEQAQRLLSLTKKKSASHSAWLMFMYPRLQLARELLRKDGVIFISIDDNEQSNLKLLCDDVFGEENKMGIILWKKKTNGNNMGVIPPVHDYILAYAKSVENVGEIGYEFTTEFFEKTFSNPDHDPRGSWTTSDLSANHKGPHFKIVNPATGQEFYPPDGRYWVFNEKEVLRRIDEGRIIFGKTGNARPCQKVFSSEREYGKQRAESWWDKHGMNEDATEEIKNLFGQAKLFVHPKPSQLLYNIVKISTDSECDHNQIIIDFFSGSATTADAVMQLNAEDNGKRQYILVQLPEDLDEKKSQKESAGESSVQEQLEFLDSVHRPHTLDQIGIERIIRAAKAIKEANPDTTADLGFKHYTLVEPSDQTLDRMYTFEPQKMYAEEDILNQFGKPTVLATWLNYDGYGLNAAVETLDLGGYTAYRCGKHLYLIDPEFSEDALKALMARYESDGAFSPDNVVLFGYSFVWSGTEMLSFNLKRLKDTEKNLRVNLDIRY